MPPPSAASSSKALQAILPQIASGHAYEAHQKARTFASRYVKSLQYDTAIDVLFQSARELLKAGQLGSGTDLGLFLIDVYESKEEKVTDESRGRLTQLIALTGSKDSWRKTLIDKFIAWTAKAGPCPAGDPELHYYVGNLMYKEGEFEAAEPHLLTAGTRDSARLLAQVFFEWSQSTHSSTPLGAFGLRGALPYLQNGNIIASRIFITHFISLWLSSRPALRSSLQSTPLTLSAKSAIPETDEVIFTTDSILNFLQLAIRTCQRAQGDRNKQIRESWVRLCGTYQSKGGLLAHPEVRKVLSELALLYFDIPLPRGQAVNPLGDMLSSLFGGPPGGGSQRRTLAPASAPVGLD